MTFHSIVREWCRTYKPMLDSVTNGNRRFYLAEGFDGVLAMPKSISTEFSPCVVMENGAEGFINGGLMTRNDGVYFFVRSERQVDSDARVVAYEEALYHALQFYTWLKDRHDRDEDPAGEYGRISFERGFDVLPAGPLEDDWVAVMMQFERMEQVNLCVDEEMYVVEDEMDDGDEPDTEAGDNTGQ